MRLDIHVYLHMPEDELERRVTTPIVAAIRNLKTGIIREMSELNNDLTDEIAELQALGAQTADGIEAARSVIQGLLDKISANAGNEVALRSLIETAKLNVDHLAQAAQPGTTTPATPVPGPVTEPAPEPAPEVPADGSDTTAGGDGPDTTTAPA